MALVVLDATGAKQTLSTTEDSSNDLVGSTCVTDPNTGAKATVAATQEQDGNVVSGNGLLTSCTPLLFNGTSFDRERGNSDASASLVVLTAQAAGTVTADEINHNHRGVQVGINISAISASTTLVVTLRGKDVVSGVYYTLLASASLNAIGFTLLTIYPGVVVTANVSANAPLPRTWNVEAVVAGSGTVTATVGASFIL